MRLLVIDDHVLFREGLVGLLKVEPDIEIAGTGGSVREAVELACRHKPDTILMDFSLPDGTGAEASAAILEELPECKIVFLTVYETDDKLIEAIRTGAKGYMLKNTPVSKLLAALRALDKGEAAISRSMTLRLMEELTRSGPAAPGQASMLLEQLSQREMDVLRVMAQGASNAEIAQKLYLSQNTVKHHVSNILLKLQAGNRREALQIARREGLS